ncbi:phage tail assembly protein [Methylobacterium gnaphalii]|uniref:Phage tail assembly protein n=1 Tax=Methylobacterium gnaphalii TaxID=1010610 RepID=A0A512JF67_9HYPH|nr:phage tail assembly protein [Methylobacterium gnaphalii]GEP08584.1 hypothetical protein MGN01_04290 [Methylobacterium gnaphalii]GJD70581.1 hypothetical protein MMMDOFMJ_3530 [Methylobacterium gnaphalii]GLS50801.1 hypothetical protein GCM10007885_36550 [Methylobacterium gnaphalii]
MADPINASIPDCLKAMQAPQITKWPYEFPLSRPIDDGQETTAVLILQEPTAKEVFRFGLLTGLAEDQVRGLVGQLAGIAPPLLDKIAGADIIALSVRLNRFFSQAAA